MKKGLSFKQNKKSNPKYRQKANKKLKQNLSVYVVRKKNQTKLGDSAPCRDCYNKMMEFGIKNIIYSCDTQDGVQIIKQRLKDYIPKTISLGRQFIDGGMIPIHRDKAHERLLHCDSEDSLSISSDSCSISSTTSKI